MLIAKLMLAALLAFAAGRADAAVESLYTRSEDVIAQDIQTSLQEAWGEVPASLVIAVEDGLVELSGEVPSREAVQQAERIAEGIEGVQYVINRTEPQEVFENVPE